jgi:RNA polymerase sigma factor (TIGR02999 family)
LTLVGARKICQNLHMSADDPSDIPPQVTLLLNEWSKGKKESGDLVIPIIYRELHKVAESHLRRERDAATLQPTVIVHEAYLRLMAQNSPDWQSRSHFFGVASRLMRQILVDRARARVAIKRGGRQVRVELDQVLNYTDAKAPTVVALDDALQALAKTDERKARLLELRYFGGLTVEETAETLGVSVATIVREGRYAEAWLRREMLRSVRKPGSLP